MSKHSKTLTKRLAEIKQLPYSAKWKEQQRTLAIRQAETIDSITNGGRYKPKEAGTSDNVIPPLPRDDDYHSRIKWQDAKDNS